MVLQKLRPRGYRAGPRSQTAAAAQILGGAYAWGIRRAHERHGVRTVPCCTLPEARRVRLVSCATGTLWN